MFFFPFSGCKLRLRCLLWHTESTSCLFQNKILSRVACVPFCRSPTPSACNTKSLHPPPRPLGGSVHWPALPGPGQVRWLSSRCWVRTWLWRRVAEENLLPHCEQRSANVLPLGGDEASSVAVAAAAAAALLSALCVWRWALRRDMRLNLRPHSSHSDHTLLLFFCADKHTHTRCHIKSCQSYRSVDKNNSRLKSSRGHYVLIVSLLCRHEVVRN